MAGSFLIGDIGGTNARFAVSDSAGDLQWDRSFKAADYPQFEDAMADYLASINSAGAEPFGGLRLAVAGPVERGVRAALTNSPWRVCAQNLRERFGVADIRLFNDLEAVALALPMLAREDCREIGECKGPPAAGNLLAVNVGTGFGAAISVPYDPTRPIATEAGHMSFAACSSDERFLSAHFTSIEDLLSGNGVVRACQLFANGTAGSSVSQLGSAADVFAAASTVTAASRTLLAITNLLARVAGDLVLATGSWGGCYFCGSVVNGWAEHADAAQFRKVFSDKGKMSKRMEPVSTRLIVHAHPGLYGLSFAR